MPIKENISTQSSSNTVIPKINGCYVIATFVTRSNVLNPFDESRNTIAVDEIRNCAPDPFVIFTENTLNEYCNSFYPNNLDIISNHTANNKSEDASPLEVFLLAKSLNNKEENKEEEVQIVNELRLVAAYALILTMPNFVLFNDLSEAYEATLSKEKKELILGHVNKFIKNNSGKNIKKPFDCHLFGLKGVKSTAHFQGNLRLSCENNSKPSDDFDFLAVVDGFKSSEMKVFLREVDEKNPVKKAAKAFIAEYASQLTTAANIYLDTSLLAQVTAYSKLNSKGVRCFYIKKIVAKEKSEVLKLALPNQTKHS